MCEIEGEGETGERQRWTETEGMDRKGRHVQSVIGGIVRELESLGGDRAGRGPDPFLPWKA